MPHFPPVQTLVIPKIDCDHLLGQFLDESHYDTLLDSDVDVYAKNPLDPPGTEIIGEDNVVLKLRKAYFTGDEQEGAYDGLIGAAKLSNNRGMAAGPVGERLRHLVPVNAIQLSILEHLADLPDNELARPTWDDVKVWKATTNPDLGTRTLVWKGDSIELCGWDFDKWLSDIINYNMSIPNIKVNVEMVWNKFISDTNYANPVHSGIAGYFGRYPRRPWGGPTAYTEQNFDKFKLAWPFLRTLSKGFRSYLPERWHEQNLCASRLDPKFIVPDTPFTTITVNRNFRTAAHRDAGDLSSGFSNLTVVAKNKNYTGGYLILPEFRAAVNLRPGDLLLVNNHEYIHGNTPISGDEGFERISLVCYFRENMLELGSAKYENLRFQFVESRRTNPKHPDWHEGFNGVSPNMWNSDEWKQYLIDHEAQDMIDEYHPELNDPSTLEDLFG